MSSDINIFHIPPAAVDVFAGINSDTQIQFEIDARADEIKSLTLIIKGPDNSITSDTDNNPDAWTINDCNGCTIVPASWVCAWPIGRYSYTISAVYLCDGKEIARQIQYGAFYVQF